MAGKKKILVENFDEEVIESLDSIKKKLEKKGKNSGYLNQEDIFEATSHFDLSEDDLDNLITYFKDKGIDVISEDAESDLDNLDVIDEDILSEDDDDILVDDDSFFDDGDIDLDDDYESLSEI